MTGRHEPEEPERIPTEGIQGEEKFFENIEEAARKTLERESRHENYKVTAGQVMIFPAIRLTIIVYKWMNFLGIITITFFWYFIYNV